MSNLAIIYSEHPIVTNLWWLMAGLFNNYTAKGGKAKGGVGAN